MWARIAVDFGWIDRAVGRPSVKSINKPLTPSPSISPTLPP